jgi:TetR/AcrR family transcriptional regulator, mexJK operon transcriptional repressor
MWTLISTNASHDAIMSTEHIHRGRGRPRDLAKRRAILDAASALFQKRGIAATSMESVAERASVSKMTVYGHFPDKPALLAAVFDRNTKAISLPELINEPDLASSIESLIDFGAHLVSYLTRREIVKTVWLMAACADEHPRLAAAFYAAGPGAMLAKVAAFLRSLVERELLSINDPELGAELLLVSWLGMSQLRQGLGVSDPPCAGAIAMRVRFATQTMLRAWSTPAKGNGRDIGRSVRAGSRRRPAKAGASARG